MKTEIKHIAKIKTGVHCSVNRNGDAIYLQAVDLQEGGSLRQGIKPNLTIRGKLHNRLLKEGDVTFMAKGIYNIATAYNPETYPAIIPSTTFLVLRVINSIILPEYLAWYLNQPEAQQYLKGQAKGSSPPSITIKILEQLKIDVPDITTQQKVLKIHQLELQEEKLKCDIENLKKTLRHQQILKAIRK